MTRVRTVGLIWGMVLGIVLVAGGAALAEAPSKAAAACKWSDVNKLKTHVQKHITYPADGKAVKAACKKEMPKNNLNALLAPGVSRVRLWASAAFRMASAWVG